MPGYRRRKRVSHNLTTLNAMSNQPAGTRLLLESPPIYEMPRTTQRPVSTANDEARTNTMNELKAKDINSWQRFIAETASCTNSTFLETIKKFNQRKLSTPKYMHQAGGASKGTFNCEKKKAACVGIQTSTVSLSKISGKRSTSSNKKKTMAKTPHKRNQSVETNCNSIEREQSGRHKKQYIMLTNSESSAHGSPVGMRHIGCSTYPSTWNMETEQNGSITDIDYKYLLRAYRERLKKQPKQSKNAAVNTKSKRREQKHRSKSDDILWSKEHTTLNSRNNNSILRPIRKIAKNIGTQTRPTVKVKKHREVHTKRIRQEVGARNPQRSAKVLRLPIYEQPYEAKHVLAKNEIEKLQSDGPSWRLKSDPSGISATHHTDDFNMGGQDCCICNTPAIRPCACSEDDYKSTTDEDCSTDGGRPKHSYNYHYDEEKGSHYDLHFDDTDSMYSFGDGHHHAPDTRENGRRKHRYEYHRDDKYGSHYDLRFDDDDNDADDADDDDDCDDDNDNFNDTLSQQSNRSRPIAKSSQSIKSCLSDGDDGQDLFQCNQLKIVCCKPGNTSNMLQIKCVKMNNTGSERRHSESRNSESRNSQSRNSESRNSQSRNSESRNSQSRNSESRNSQSRNSQSRNSQSRNSQSRNSTSRLPESRKISAGHDVSSKDDSLHNSRGASRNSTAQNSIMRNASLNSRQSQDRRSSADSKQASQSGRPSIDSKISRKSYDQTLQHGLPRFTTQAREREKRDFDSLEDQCAIMCKYPSQWKLDCESVPILKEGTYICCSSQCPYNDVKLNKMRTDTLCEKDSDDKRMTRIEEISAPPSMVRLSGSKFERVDRGSNPSIHTFADGKKRRSSANSNNSRSSENSRNSRRDSGSSYISSTSENASNFSKKRKFVDYYDNNRSYRHAHRFRSSQYSDRQKTGMETFAHEPQPDRRPQHHRLFEKPNDSQPRTSYCICKSCKKKMELKEKNSDSEGEKENKKNKNAEINSISSDSISSNMKIKTLKAGTEQFSETKPNQANKMPDKEIVVPNQIIEDGEPKNENVHPFTVWQEQQSNKPQPTSAIEQSKVMDKSYCNTEMKSNNVHFLECSTSTAQPESAPKETFMANMQNSWNNSFYSNPLLEYCTCGFNEYRQQQLKPQTPKSAKSKHQSPFLDTLSNPRQEYCACDVNSYRAVPEKSSVHSSKSVNQPMADYPRRYPTENNSQNDSIKDTRHVCPNDDIKVLYDSKYKFYKDKQNSCFDRKPSISQDIERAFGYDCQVSRHGSKPKHIITVESRNSVGGAESKSNNIKQEKKHKRNSKCSLKNLCFGKLTKLRKKPILNKNINQGKSSSSIFCKKSIVRTFGYCNDGIDMSNNTINQKSKLKERSSDGNKFFKLSKEPSSPSPSKSKPTPPVKPKPD